MTVDGDTDGLEVGPLVGEDDIGELDGVDVGAFDGADVEGEAVVGAPDGDEVGVDVLSKKLE